MTGTHGISGTNHRTTPELTRVYHFQATRNRVRVRSIASLCVGRRLLNRSGLPATMRRWTEGTAC